MTVISMLNNMKESALRLMALALIALGLVFVGMACMPEIAHASSTAANASSTTSSTAKASASPTASPTAKASASSTASPTTSTTVSVVSNDSFAPEGYEWFLDFTNIEIESGWQPVADLSDGHIGSFFSPDVVRPGQNGFAAYINDSIPAGTDFTLRMTGGFYNETPIDALVTISDWDYWNGPEGNQVGKSKYFRSESWGLAGVGAIYFNPNWTSDPTIMGGGTRPSTLNNLNFFSVGMRSFTVSVTFVEAGTDKPIQVAGHMTCTDLDCMQQFGFDGAIQRAEIAEKSTEECPQIDGQSKVEGKTNWLNVINNGTSVYGSSIGISADDSDQNYQRGLVGTYFDTGSERSTAIELTFSTPYGTKISSEAMAIDPELGVWSEPDACYFNLNPVGFFSMTPEYLCSPPWHAGGGATISKSILSESPIGSGDNATWRISVTLPKEGVQVRTGYRLDSLIVSDSLSKHLEYQDDAKISIDGTPLSSEHYSFSIEKDASSGEHMLTWTFAQDYLDELRCLGQQIDIDFNTTALDYPSPEEWNETRLPIPNEAEVFIVGDSLKSNTVHTEMISPQKTINGDTNLVTDVRIGDTISYAIKQHVRNLNEESLDAYQQFTLHDPLPEYVEYIEGSFSVTDPNGNEIDASAGTLDYDKATNALSYTFSNRYLAEGMIYDGGLYTFAFEVKVIDHPEDPQATVDNHAFVNINTFKAKTNVVSYEPIDPMLAIEKKSAGDGIFKVGDVAEYEVKVSNTIEGSIARNVSIVDELTASSAQIAKIIEGSIAIYDGENALIEGCQIEPMKNDEGNIIGFSIQTNRDLTSSESIIVRYQMQFLAASEPDPVTNVAIARAENAPEVEDEELVVVKEPVSEEKPPAKDPEDPPSKIIDKTGDPILGFIGGNWPWLALGIGALAAVGIAWRIYSIRTSEQEE